MTSSSTADDEPGHVLAIQSHVVHGYVGNRACVFPLQLLGFEVDFVNSVQLSNHTGYRTYKGQVLDGTDLKCLVDGLEENSLLSQYTHMITGYIGSASFLAEVESVVHRVRAHCRHLLYVCDPVLGDYDQGMYVPESLIPEYRARILPLASVITPNQFEVEKLTGRSAIKDDTELFTAVDELHRMGPGLIFVTSTNLPQQSADKVVMLASEVDKESGRRTRYRMEVPFIEGNYTGTGDLTTALLMAFYTQCGVKAAMSRTGSVLQSVINRTREYHETNVGISGNPTELRLLQSKRDIEDPKTQYDVTTWSLLAMDNRPGDASKNDSRRTSRHRSRREAEPGRYSFYDEYNGSRSSSGQRQRRHSESGRSRSREPRSWYDARDEDLCRRSRSRERPVAKLTKRPDAATRRRESRDGDEREGSRPILRPARRERRKSEDERDSQRDRSSPRQQVVLRPKFRPDKDDTDTRGPRRRYAPEDSSLAAAAGPPRSRPWDQESRYRNTRHAYQEHQQPQQQYIILKNVPPGTNEATIRSRFRSLGQRPISVDHFPGKGVAFVYFRDERQCESAVAAFQSSGSKMRENDDVQVSAMLVPTAQNPPRARELACQIERSQRDNVLRAAVEEHDYEETLRRTRNLAMGGINSDMWHSYLGDSGEFAERTEEGWEGSPKPREGDTLPFCKCMVYDDVAEHYYDEEKNWAYNPKTGFWYHRDGIYYTYYEPLGVLVGYAEDSPVRALPGGAELTDEQQARVRREMNRMAAKAPSQGAPSSSVPSEPGDGSQEGEERRTRGSSKRRVQPDGASEAQPQGPGRGLIRGSQKSQRTKETERSSLGTTKLASIHFNPNQFGTMSMPAAQEQKSRVLPQAIALDTAPAPLASEPVILSKQPLGDSKLLSRTASLEGDGGAVCLLCQRRFNSVELLLRHEKLSKLHKANLERKKNSGLGLLGDEVAYPRSKLGVRGEVDLDDMALGKVLGALVNLFTTLHGRMHEPGSGYPTGPPPVSTDLLAPIYALVSGHTDSEELLGVAPSPPQPGSGEPTADDTARGRPEMGVDGLRGRTRNKEGSPEEHRAALRSVIGHWSSSPSSPTSVTSVGEGDSGTATIDGTVDDTPTRGVLKRCSHHSFREYRRCHRLALAASEFCELHHCQPCSSDRRRCPACEVRLPTDAEIEHHCRGLDYGEELAGKEYYSRDCNSGPMLCVADSGERCDIGDTEWQERVLRQSEGCDETNSYQFEVRGLDSIVPPAVRRHYVRVEAVTTRVTAILAAAARNGVTDLVLVEYQCEGAGLSYAIAERITTSLALSPDSKVTFLLVTNRSEGLPSGGACEAIESLRCGFTVAGVV
ncbi:hypothetical protein FOZ62_012314, partial [Perkinsus olseni]